MSKIVFITSRFPYPLDKGDKLRVFYQLKSLCQNGNEIHLITITDTKVNEEDLKVVRDFCTSITCYHLPIIKRIIGLPWSILKKIPLQVQYFYHSSIRKKIEHQIQQLQPDFIHAHLIRTTEYIKNISQIPKSLDFMDAFGIGMEKRRSVEKRWYKKMLFSYEKSLIYKYESSVFGFIDRFAIISEQDREAIQHKRSEEIVIVPNGVDFSLFYPREDIKKYDLVFMGNMSYPPNIEAVHFLIKKVMPLVISSHPDIKLLIAGIGCPSEIKSQQSDHIEVIENFKDISDSIAWSRIMIAPMQISIGLQNKIIQGMAMKIPCVVSKKANNPIGAIHNESILEAEKPEEYASMISHLMNDPGYYTSIANNGYNFVREHFSWNKHNSILESMIKNKLNPQ